MLALARLRALLGFPRHGASLGIFNKSSEGPDMIGIFLFHICVVKIHSVQATVLVDGIQNCFP